jgi:hypothetical protein
MIHLLVNKQYELDVIIVTNLQQEVLFNVYLHLAITQLKLLFHNNLCICLKLKINSSQNKILVNIILLKILHILNFLPF